MTRPQKRAVSLVGIFLAGGFLVWIGLGGWQVRHMPAHYLGFLVLAVGVGALFGLNVWYGGPLDPRNDPKTGESLEPPPRSNADESRVRSGRS